MFLITFDISGSFKSNTNKTAFANSLINSCSRQNVIEFYSTSKNTDFINKLINFCFLSWEKSEYPTTNKSFSFLFSKANSYKILNELDFDLNINASIYETNKYVLGESTKVYSESELLSTIMKLNSSLFEGGIKNYIDTLLNGRIIECISELNCLKNNPDLVNVETRHQIVSGNFSVLFDSQINTFKNICIIDDIISNREVFETWPIFFDYIEKRLNYYGEIDKGRKTEMIAKVNKIILSSKYK